MMDQETQRVFDILRQYVQKEQAEAKREARRSASNEGFNHHEGREAMAADMLRMLDKAELQLSGVRRIPPPTEAEKP